MNYSHTYFTKLRVASAIAIIAVVGVSVFSLHQVQAATGINRTINFQGKLVDSTGLNVADSTYSVVFAIYDRTSSGTTMWSETQSVTTVDGIFRVSLGSSTPIPANFNFNWDGLYLGMKVGADAEMTPRIRLAAVPYAFNAEKVAGLTVQDENGNASTSGTLKIPNGKTVSFGGAFTTTAGNDLTFTTSANTTLSLGGSGSLTLVDTSTAQTLTGKIIGSSGLTFTGATTDITTGTNESLVIIPNGTGLIGIGTTTAASFFHVYGGQQGGNALAIFDQRGAITNDIFTASAGGVPKFTIRNNGNVGIGTTLPSSTLYVNGTTTGNAALTVVQNTGTGDIFTASAGATPKFVIDRSGNVGIGQNVPSGFNLDVTGTARFTGAITVGSCSGCSGSSQWTTATNDIYYATGEVGIGTTNPLAPLHVYGITGGNAALLIDQRENNSPDLLTASSSGTSRFTINNNGNIGVGTTLASSTLDLRGATTGNALMMLVQNTTAGDLLTASSGATTRFTLRNNGNLGIGTSLPASLLDLRGTTTGNALASLVQNTFNADVFTASAAATSIFTVRYNGNVGIGTTLPSSLLDLRGATTGNALATLVQNTLTGDIFTASAGATSRFTIRNNGNVGIGTTIPASTLTINGTTTGNAALTVIQNTGTGDIFTASAGATPKFVIDRAGNVGIGVNVPSSFILQLAGNVGPNTNSSYDLGSSSLRWRSAYLGTSGAGAAITINDGSNNGTIGTVTGGLDIQTGNLRFLMPVSGATINDSFYIVDAVANQTRFNQFREGALSIGVNSSATTATAGLSVVGSYKGNALGIFNQTGTADIFTASSSGVSKFTLRNNGNVGIGTTLPASMLDIRGTTTSNALVTLVQNTGTGDIFTASVGATPKFVIDRAGNVGIGSSVPSGFNLDVTGTARFTGAITVSSCSGCGGVASQWTTSGQGIYFAQGGNTVGIGTTSPLTLLHLYDTRGGNASLVIDQRNTNADMFTASSAGTTKFVIDKSGNVGIGVSVPTAPITIDRDFGSNAVGIEMRGQSGNGSILNVAQSGYNAWGVGMLPGSQDFVFLNNYSAPGTHGGQILTLSGTGSVGIGTTVAFGKLNVVGEATKPLGKAALVVIQNELNQDVLTASVGASPKFTVTYAGGLKLGTSEGTSLQCLLSGGAGLAASWGSCGGASSSWSNITNPLGNLSLTMGTNISTFNWATGTGANNLLNLTTDTTTNGTGSMLYLGAGSSATNDLIKAQKGSNEAFSILNNSYVGFGTFSPQYRMTIWGNESTANGGGAAMQFSNKATGGSDWYLRAGATGTTTAAGGISLANNQAYWWGLDGAGRMGVGPSSTAPAAQLHVNGGTQGGNALVIFDQQSSTNADILAASDSGTTRFVVKQNGNVGIGTSLPTEALDVEGGNIMIGAQTNSTSAQNWTKISGTAGTIGGGATTAIASVSATAIYNGSLYVGTSKTNGAEVYRYNGATAGTWTKVTNATAGTITTSGTANIDSVSSMVVYNGYLYIGTTETNSAEIYRYNGGTTWTKISGTTGTVGGGATTNIDGINAMVVFRGSIYAGTSEVTRAEIYRYDYGAAGTTWTKVTGTAGTVGTSTLQDTVTAMGVYNNYLWSATSRGTGNAALYRYVQSASTTTWLQETATLGSFTINTGAVTAFTAVNSIMSFEGAMILGMQKTSGAELLRYEDNGGSLGTTANPNFTRLGASAGTLQTGGTGTIAGVMDLVTYNGKLYVGTAKSNASEIYRYEGVPGQMTKVHAGAAGVIGNGNTNIDAIAELISYNGVLYAGTQEPAATEIYTYTYVSDQSYALKFHASGTQAGGEQNNLLNLGQISFIASPSASSNMGRVLGGQFLFSHGLMTSFGAYDIAEDYPTRDDTIEAGDVVTLDENEKGFVKKSSTAYERGVIGVFSENPGFRLSQQDTTIDGGQAIPVALVGRVPVKVTTENGEIKPGDYLTASSKSGVAMKATKAGAVVGKALEGFAGDGIGKVLTFVTIANSSGDTLSSIMPGLENVAADDLAKTYLGLISAGVSSASAIDAKTLSEIVTDRLTAGVEVITPKISTNTIRLDQIRALTGADVSLQLTHDGKFVINGETGAPAITFDALGNAVFAGTVKANKIQANQIEGLEFITGTIASLSASFASLNTSVSNSSSTTSVTTQTTVSTSTNILSLTSLSVDGLATVSADLRVKGNGLIEGMLSVIDVLTARNFIVTGIADFFGNVVFHSDVSFKGRPTFNSDTVGSVVIKKGQRQMDVVFEKEYEISPVINASIVIDEKKNDDGKVLSASDSAEAIFTGNYSVMVVNRTTKGFTIILNKETSDDIQVSWSALSGVSSDKRKDAK